MCISTKESLASDNLPLYQIIFFNIFNTVMHLFKNVEFDLFAKLRNKTKMRIFNAFR